MPVKGTKKRARIEHTKVSLADALFGRTKQRVLGLVFGQPQRTFGTVELIELAASGRGAVQRELELLTRSGLIKSEVVGLQKRYRANEDAPVFEELRRIVEKTSGVGAIVGAALAPLESKIAVAILYGSIAKHEDTSRSDIDVLLVSDDVTMEDAYRALEPAEARLGRRISPTIYDRAEFRTRRQEKHGFVNKVLSGPYVVLSGTLDGDRATR
jgi:predicted nucleotidyltransferase